MLEWTEGIDISKWQDAPDTTKNIDLGKAYEQGARFVMVRAGIGKKADRNFEYARQNAKDNNMLWGSYWYFNFEFTPAYQANKYIETMRGDYGNLPMAIDIEKPLPPKSQKDWFLDQCKSFVDFIEEPMERTALIYSNPSFFRYYVGYSNVPFWMTQRDLWIAHYLSKPPFYIVHEPNPDPSKRSPNYKPWPAYKIWQYSDRGDGIAHGMESKQVDRNYFNGSLEELKKYANVQEPQPIPVPPDDPPDKPAMIYQGQMLSEDSHYSVWWEPL